jgi:hypothetical protein
MNDAHFMIQLISDTHIFGFFFASVFRPLFFFWQVDEKVCNFCFFNDAFNNYDYIAPDDVMINEK